MTPEELQELGVVWRTIKRSSFAELEFRTMTKDDARGIMALFEEPKRANVSRTLNDVRKWSLAVPILGGTQDEVSQIESPRTAGHPSGPVPIVPLNTDSRELPGGETMRMARPGRPDRGHTASLEGSGPVEGWEPPAAGPVISAPIPNQTLWIGAGVAVLVALLVWLLFIRGDDTDGQVVETGDTAAQTTAADVATTADFTGSDSDDFCTVARELDENDPFDDAALSTFGPEFFDQAITLFGRMSAIAPAEIKGDIDISAQQLAQMRAVSAQYDFNLADPELGTALTQMDTSALDASTDRLDAYLLQVCGIGTAAS